MGKKVKVKAPAKSTNHLDPRVVVAVGILVAMVGGLLQHWRAAEQDDSASIPSIAAHTSNSAWNVIWICHWSKRYARAPKKMDFSFFY